MSRECKHRGLPIVIAAKASFRLSTITAALSLGAAYRT
jgi:hypothetical protein